MSAPVPETAPEPGFEAAQDVDPGESRHRYPARAVLLDYLYSGLGLLFTLGPLAGTAPSGPAAWVLGGLAALFAVYGARTVLRHRTSLRVSEEEIVADGLLRRHLPWNRLTRCTLGYYATRRNRDRGWMQLTLKAGGRSLRIDSQIEGFDRIVRRAVHAAQRRDIAFDNTTQENLRALGITTGDADPVADPAPDQT